MIKFIAETRSGGRMIGFGLTEENVKRLKEDKPIQIHLGELGLPFNIEIAIFYGETEKKIQEDLSRHIGPETEIISTPPMKN